MPTKLLHVSPNQALPVAVLQDSTTVFGRKRVGKSNNAVVIVEEYLDLHGQVIVLDPKGDWWGMTSSADGKAEGYPLVIIGGKHSTPGVELNPLAGATTAEWVIKTGYSVILDLSQLRPSEVDRFCSAFLERIRRLKVETPGPILIVIDEADELAPEDRNARLAVIDTYSAVVWMVKRGGFAGVGTLVITQRPASLSKNVTTQSETVIVLQVTGSQDLDAISDALKHHVAGETKKDRTVALEELLRSIVQLDKGQAVIVSASPDLKGRILTVPFRRRRTFDSGASPKFGEQPKAPKVVAKVALAQLSAEMEKAVAEAKANDPALLRTQLADQAKRIRELEGLYERALAATKVETKHVDVPVLKKGELARLERVLRAFDSLTSRFSGVEHDMGEAVRPVYAAIQQVLSAPSAAASTLLAPQPTQGAHQGRRVDAAAVRAAIPTERAIAARGPQDGHGDQKADERAARTTDPISARQQEILNAAAFFETLGVQPDATQLGLFAGVVARGGYWRELIGGLRTRGLMEGLQLTDAGRELARSPRIASTQDLQAKVLEMVSGRQRDVLRALIEVYPAGLSAQELGERVGLTPVGGYWREVIGGLRSRGLITKSGPIAALPVLFLEAA